ncbi:thiamine pyrophosphate-binding protein [Alkalicoccus urumqiensis]|uniref:Acetolactate synthase n=1 Tax=Alkalicoccus urumqiensis TaxID=1548213 RepID=A0A2P6MIK5_ALKUR|nr:thiamine pyrophosphate-binding protein [Alkalicoccus urumqiensis]PRO66110.1 acetolactate synthase [Alkalicoccus urumqiensis]
MTAAVLADQLLSWGIKHIFGIPGKPVVPLILAADNAGLPFVLAKHECGGGYQAAGAALATGLPAVAIGTSGPGGTNMITAAAQAKALHAPVLFITGHPSIQASTKPQGQDSSMYGTDLTRLFEPVTKFSARIERPDNVRQVLDYALHKALTGKKGPVHLSIPADVLTAEIEPFQLPLPVDSPLRSGRLEEAAQLLSTAEKPMILAGKGIDAAGCYDELTAFAEAWQIPVSTTPGGKGCFLTGHPLSLGAFGLGGNDRPHAYVEEGVDVLVVLGSKLSDMSVAGWPQEKLPSHIIHVDIDGSVIGRTFDIPVTAIEGDLKENLHHFPLPETKPGLRPLPDVEEPVPDGGGRTLSTAAAVRLLKELVPDDAVLYGDDGSHTFYAIQQYPITQPGSFYFDDVFGAMGHGLGLAIGAKLAAPEQTTVCLTGDGCLFMHGTEIATAVEHGAAVLFIVVNNEALDMVDKGMKRHVGRSVGTVYKNPVNAAMFAQGLGADAVRVYSEEELRRALDGRFPLTEPLVVELCVDTEEIPPTMRRG